VFQNSSRLINYQRQEASVSTPTSGFGGFSKNFGNGDFVPVFMYKGELLL
jgi:hypothetical protein